MEDFRDKVLKMGEKGLKVVNYIFDGKKVDPAVMNIAASMAREAVKVSNRDQVDQQVKRSQALKLLQFIPEKRRNEYISLTNPEVKPFLLDRPRRK